MAADEKTPIKDRISSLSLLARNSNSDSNSAAEQKTDYAILASLLGPQSPSELQRAAVQRLGETHQIEPLLKAWSNSSPALRASIVNQCLNQQSNTTKLLDAIESKSIAASAIDAAGRDRLIRSRNTAVRTRAENIFKDATNTNRNAVIAKFSPALKLKGDPAKGRESFTAVCSVCHQLDGIGRHIGPDLTALSDHSSIALLTGILDPNRAIEDKFLLYSITLKKGESLAGMIIDESGGSLTLQILDGSQRSLLRSEIKTLESIGLSAMPEGLEAALDTQKLADLIAFIKKAAQQKK